MASPLSTNNIQATEQRGLNWDQLVPLSTRVEKQTKVAVAQLFDESGEVVCSVHSNKLLHENGLKLLTIHHTTMDRANADIAYHIKCYDPEKPSEMIEDTGSANKYMWESCE